MFKSVVYTCRCNVYDMFDEMRVMDGRGPDEFLMMWLIPYLFFNVIYHILHFHEVLSSDLGYGSKNMTQISQLQAHNWPKWALATTFPWHAHEYRILDTTLSSHAHN